MRSVSNQSELSGFAPFAAQSVTARRTEMATGGLSSSRLGLRGTEDLGGGLYGSFWLEAPIRNDDGTEGLSTFSRRSVVSLGGSFGEIRLGRDNTPVHLNHL